MGRTVRLQRPGGAPVEAEVLADENRLNRITLDDVKAVGGYIPRVDRWTLVANDLCRHAVLDRTMVLLTSNLAFSKWDQIFKDKCG